MSCAYDSTLRNPGKNKSKQWKTSVIYSILKAFLKDCVIERDWHRHLIE